MERWQVVRAQLVLTTPDVPSHLEAGLLACSVLPALGWVDNSGS
jgi:hypothetical protein